MSPPLPTELLRDILALALDEAEPAKRQKTRLAFGRVCRSWCAAVDWWKQIEIIGPVQLDQIVGRLATQPGNSHLGQTIQRVYLELVGKTNKNNLHMIQRDFDSFFLRSPNITALELRLERHSLIRSDAASSISADQRGTAIGPALSSLRSMTHFKLTKPSSAHRPVSLFFTWIRRILQNWTALETCALDGCFSIVPSEPGRSQTIWPKHSALHSVSLHALENYPNLQACLAGIPPSVRSISIDDEALFAWDSVELFDIVTDRVEELRLLDTIEVEDITPGVNRGGWGAVIGQMKHLRRLTLSPCGVVNLASALLPLTLLEELVLTYQSMVPDPPMPHSEVIEFLSGAKALRHLVLGREVWSKWSPAQLYAVEREAKIRNIALELRQKSNGPEIFIR